jgi:hypothetical protein
MAAGRRFRFWGNTAGAAIFRGAAKGKEGGAIDSRRHALQQTVRSYAHLIKDDRTWIDPKFLNFTDIFASARLKAKREMRVLPGTIVKSSSRLFLLILSNEVASHCAVHVRLLQ